MTESKRVKECAGSDKDKARKMGEKIIMMERRRSIIQVCGKDDDVCTGLGRRTYRRI